MRRRGAQGRKRKAVAGGRHPQAPSTGEGEGGHRDKVVCSDSEDSDADEGRASGKAPWKGQEEQGQAGPIHKGASHKEAPLGAEVAGEGVLGQSTRMVLDPPVAAEPGPQSLAVSKAWGSLALRGASEVDHRGLGEAEKLHGAEHLHPSSHPEPSSQFQSQGGLLHQPLADGPQGRGEEEQANRTHAVARTLSEMRLDPGRAAGGEGRRPLGQSPSGFQMQLGQSFAVACSAPAWGRQGIQGERDAHEMDAAAETVGAAAPASLPAPGIASGAPQSSHSWWEEEQGAQPGALSSAPFWATAGCAPEGPWEAGGGPQGEQLSLGSHEQLGVRRSEPFATPGLGEAPQAPHEQSVLWDSQEQGLGWSPLGPPAELRRRLLQEQLGSLAVGQGPGSPGAAVAGASEAGDGLSLACSGPSGAPPPEEPAVPAAGAGAGTAFQESLSAFHGDGPQSSTAGLPTAEPGLGLSAGRDTLEPGPGSAEDGALGLEGSELQAREPEAPGEAGPSPLVPHSWIAYFSHEGGCPTRSCSTDRSCDVGRGSWQARTHEGREEHCMVTRAYGRKGIQ